MLSCVTDTRAVISVFLFDIFVKMATTRLEAAFADLSKKVAALTAGVASQSTLIEAQNKKIEDQQRTIENCFSTINELKRVLEEMPAKICDRWHEGQSKKEAEIPVVVPTTQRASETTVSSEPSAVMRSNMSQRALRALNRANKGASTTSGKIGEDGEVLNPKGTVASEEWTVVGGQKKSRKSLLKPVHTGGNVQIDSFQAIQKKKFLHVWSLHPDTTENSIAGHVKKICGSEDIKIEKVIPKTKRDYSSFMIGVPESMFEKLNSADSWPVNTRFNEWVWFRNSRK